MVRIQRAICTFQLIIIVKTIVRESMGIVESMHKADINDVKDEKGRKEYSIDIFKCVQIKKVAYSVNQRNVIN